MKIDMDLNKKVAIGLRKGHSRPTRHQEKDLRHPKRPPGRLKKSLRRHPGDPFFLLQDHLRTLPHPENPLNSKKWIIVERGYEKHTKS